MDDLGCEACHSTTGTRRVGPSFLSLSGQVITVLDAQGASHQVTVNDAYIRESILDPNAMAREDYPRGMMPSFDLKREEVDDLISAITYLSDPEAVEERKQEEGTLLLLCLSCLLFVGGHLGLSFPPVRRRLFERLKERGYMWLYSIVVSVGLGAIIWAWTTVPYIELWTLGRFGPWVPVLVMPFVFVLLVASLSTPGSINAARGSEEEPARGIGKVSRHPMNVSILLWACCHLVVNGDVASMVLFGSFILLVVLGTRDAENRYRRNPELDWARVEAVTSIVPLAAVLQGRTSVKLREVGALRILAGLGIYAFVLLWYHQAELGVSPMPW